MNTDSLNAVDVSNLDVVAKVSTRAPRRPRWTEISIYYRPGERRPFVAEIIGGSNVVGEQKRTRRRVYAELEGCFDFFDSGDLTERARTQAAEWFRRNRHKLSDHAREAAGTALGTTLGFTGRKLSEAIDWLYPDGTGELEWTLDERLESFGRHWNIEPATVRVALAKEANGTILPVWCSAFIVTLRFFDRVAFHTAGGRNVYR